jgi:hypothetical protein
MCEPSKSESFSVVELSPDLLHKLSGELGLELMKPSQDLLRRKLGLMEESRNNLLIAQHQNDLVVLKAYIDKRHFEDSLERAATEQKILNHLHSKGFANTFELASQATGRDLEGNVVRAFKYREGLFPVPTLKELLTAELTGQTEPILTAKLIDIIYKTHQAKCFHGDLHLGNLSVSRPLPSQPLKYATAIIFDWEEGDIMTSDSKTNTLARMDDLRYLSSNLLALPREKLGKPGINQAAEILKTILNTQYPEPESAQTINFQELLEDAKLDAWEVI